MMSGRTLPNRSRGFVCRREDAQLDAAHPSLWIGYEGMEYDGETSPLPTGNRPCYSATWLFSQGSYVAPSPQRLTLIKRLKNR